MGIRSATVLRAISMTEFPASAFAIALAEAVMVRVHPLLHRRCSFAALVLSIGVLTSIDFASAATMEVIADETPEHPAIILIKGKFTIENKNKDADLGLFVTIAGKQKKPAVVFLDSPGGTASV